MTDIIPGTWVRHFKTGRFGQVVDIAPDDGYTVSKMLRIKLMDGTCVWSASHLWGIVGKGGVVDPRSA